jgi:formate hydrogenlyase subunit 6/NADH:ubiquinone oxidoreductase subunit I
MFKVDKEKCAGCGACVNVCPAGAISMKDDKAVISNKCVDCGRCAQVCPADAIYPGTQSGQDITSDQGQMFPGGGRGRGVGCGMGKGLGRGPRDGRGGGRGGGWKK